MSNATLRGIFEYLQNSKSPVSTRQKLADMLLEMNLKGLIEFSSTLLPIAEKLNDRPVASRLARLQVHSIASENAQFSEAGVCNLAGYLVSPTDAVLHLLPYLDGQHTCQDCEQLFF